MEIMITLQINIQGNALKIVANVKPCLWLVFSPLYVNNNKNGFIQNYESMIEEFDRLIFRKNRRGLDEGLSKSQ